MITKGTEDSYLEVAHTDLLDLGNIPYSITVRMSVANAEGIKEDGDKYPWTWTQGFVYTKRAKTTSTCDAFWWAKAQNFQMRQLQTRLYDNGYQGLSNYGISGNDKDDDVRAEKETWYLWSFHFD